MIDIVEKTGKFSAICKCARCHQQYPVKSIYGAAKSPVGDICDACKTTISGMTNPTQAALLNVFSYNTQSGELTHTYTTLSGAQDSLATFAHSRGYLSVCVGKTQYLAHRVIYLMMTGNWPEHIDHINHIKHDNRWDNLRNTSQEDNNRNMPKQTNSTTGILGVSLHQPTGKYRAYISVKGRAKHLGLFDTVAAAKAARETANAIYGYHHNHGK